VTYRCEFCWKGRPIEELTREELIEAMHEIAAFYEARLAERYRQELNLDDEACFAVRPISIGGEPGPIFCVLRKGHEGRHTNRKGSW